MAAPRRPSRDIAPGMLGLNGGELFVIGFVVIAVVSARWWPMLGAAIAERLAGAPSDPAPVPPGDEPDGQ
jgi:hypothetical protein